MTHKITHEGSKAILALEGNLTLSIIPELRDAIKELLAQGVSELVVDLAGVQVVDSSGIGLLVAVHNSLERLSGSMAVINASPDLLELFKAFRLDKHFSILGTPGVQQN
jgi:anti-anti-sigma factor